MAKQDLYSVLGVTQTATTSEIKRAYRAIARECHPDIVGSDTVQLARFNAVTEAYDVLSDPVKRRIYDHGFQPASSIEALLLDRPIGQNFVEQMLPSAPMSKQGGVDAVIVLALSPELLEEGGSIAWPEYTADGRVDAMASFQVPTGADKLPWCLLPGLGAPGRNGGDPGDLYVLVFPA